MPTRPTTTDAARRPALAVRHAVTLVLAGAALALPAPARAQAPPTSPAQPPAPPMAQPMPPPGAQPMPPPGAQPMPQYYPPPLEIPPWANPKTIEYEDGDPIPYGYELKTRPQKGLLISGLTIWASAYAIAFVIGSVGLASGDNDAEQFSPLLIPIAGPFITIPTANAKGAGLFWLTVNGVVQTGGVVMLAAAFASEDVYLQRTADPVGQRGPAATPLLRPAIAIGPNSAALRWKF